MRPSRGLGRRESGGSAGNGNCSSGWWERSMRFSVLALDFDGTIARNDVLDPDVRAAIADLRAQNVVVVLVTGRILDDLRRVAGDLHFVDAIVAENGAVMAFPDSGYVATPGPPPPTRLLDELRHEGIAFTAGSTVVEAAASDATRLLAILQRLELPLVLAFNRSRVMVLPQAVSKATGLKDALTVLRLSLHNAVGIGDAENDHELLRACEVGVAVGWGSPVLQSEADVVLPGEGPHAVAGYLRTLASSRRVPHPVRTRRHLLLGHAHDGRPVSLAVRGRNVLIAGDPASGKSWVTGLLCEQLILLGYCLCLVDPEGDYVSLEALPGVRLLGGTEPLPRPRELLRALRHPDVSVVLDLSHVDPQAKRDYVRAFLPALATLRRHSGLPHRIVVDEAHHFLQGEDVPSLLDLETNGYTLVSYRASQLHPAVLAASQAVVVTRESDPEEVHRLFSLCGPCPGTRDEAQWRTLLEELVLGEAVLLPVTTEAGGDVRRVRLTPRLTPHVRHLAKYIDLPVAESRAFVFARNGSAQRARTIREFVVALEGASTATLDGHLRRHDFSRWIADVFGDYLLAKSVRRLEDEYRPVEIQEVTSRLCQLVRARYEFVEPIPREDESPVDSPPT
jgi:hydroxymethylpyrimidine pyrophosphatase-like HAD family hydrolase